MAQIPKIPQMSQASKISFFEKPRVPLFDSNTDSGRTVVICFCCGRGKSNYDIFAESAAPNLTKTDRLCTQCEYNGWILKYSKNQPYAENIHTGEIKKKYAVKYDYV